MSESVLFPQNQRQNLLQSFEQQILSCMEEADTTQDRAFLLAALDVLGYEINEDAVTDGKGDYGIDFIDVQENRANIYQFKSQEYDDGIQTGVQVPPAMLIDLHRIRNVLEDLDNIPKQANAKLQSALKGLRSAIDRYGRTDDGEVEPYTIDVHFVSMSDGFTKQARDELDKLESGAAMKWGRNTIQLRYYPVLLDDLLAEKWRESNADWRTSEGRKEECIRLSVCGEMIASAKSVVFFTKAIDLIHAFDMFGYQIFEPNVRCELKRSRVNEAIRASISTSRGRREFKHLNNGLTLICASFKKEKDGTEIRVRQPGVINGLQTVKSIHDSFEDLTGEAREHFQNTCEVLVRLHMRDAVGDYRELVKSTNNQNPMQPRNLRSNDPEQLDYERLFADIGWFYERKEGAWQAYRSDHHLWGSLKGYKAESFKSSITGQIRNVDNLDLSQAWLSFLGFSDQAIHSKKDIFIDDRYYDLIFRKRVSQHGYDYDFKLIEAAVLNEAEDQAPSHYMLLTSLLAYEIAGRLTPSRKQNREEAVKRLKLERLKKEEQDAKLSEDNVYTKGLVLAGARYLFPEFCGLLLFRALGRKAHLIGPKLVLTKSLRPIVEHRNFEPLIKAIQDEEFASGDFFAIAWALYNFCLEQIMGLPSWRQQFQQAAVRSRFNYSDFNRRELYKQLEALDKVYQKRPFPAPWSQGFEEAKGIIAYFRQVFG